MVRKWRCSMSSSRGDLLQLVRSEGPAAACFWMPKYKSMWLMREKESAVVLNHIMPFIIATLAAATCWSESEVNWSFWEGKAPRPTSLEELP